LKVEKDKSIDQGGVGEHGHTCKKYCYGIVEGNDGPVYASLRKKCTGERQLAGRTSWGERGGDGGRENKGVSK